MNNYGEAVRQSPKEIGAVLFKVYLRFRGRLALTDNTRVFATWFIKAKEEREHDLYVTIPVGWGPCPDFVLGLWNQLIHSKVPTKEQILYHLGQSDCLDYTSMIIHLFLFLTVSFLGGRGREVKILNWRDSFNIWFNL